MSEAETQKDGKEARPKPLEEARPLIEEYAAEIGEMIRRLRHKMN